MTDSGRDDRRSRALGVQRTVIVLLVMLLSGGLGATVLPSSNGIALAAGTYYVNGATGLDSNDCLESSAIPGQPNTGPCRTIGDAVFKASAGDTVDIAGGVYCEEITIGKSLTVQAQDPANPPTIDGGHGSGTTCPAGMPKASVVTVGTPNPYWGTVTLLGLTIQNGDASNNPNTQFVNTSAEGGESSSTLAGR